MCFHALFMLRDSIVRFVRNKSVEQSFEKNIISKYTLSFLSFKNGATNLLQLHELCRTVYQWPLRNAIRNEQISH